jgi:hypothetical protein
VDADLDRLVDPQDRDYVGRIESAEQRAVVVSALLRYRVPERLAAGDPVPATEVHRLDPEGTVPLDRLADGRPLVLVFGSYT